MLYGYSEVILKGTLVTLELALSSVLLAVVLGLIGAGAKLSRSRPLAMLFEGYTTLIRGVPDLVLMLLIFYGLQIALNALTDAMGLAQFDIDPMAAGIITLGFIYGAYFTETFGGAFFAVSERADRSGNRLRLYRLAGVSPHSVPRHDALRAARHRQ